jgi:hypothetical protein
MWLLTGVRVAFAAWVNGCGVAWHRGSLEVRRTKSLARSLAVPYIEGPPPSIRIVPREDGLHGLFNHAALSGRFPPEFRSSPE